MKIQKRGRDSTVVSLDEVASVRVRRPQEDSDGFIRIETADGQRYRIFFEDDQFQDAVQFKRQFDAAVSDDGDYALDIPPAAFNSGPAWQPGQSRGSAPRAAREYDDRSYRRRPIFRKWWFWVASVVLIIGVIAIFSGGPKDNGAVPVAAGGGANNAVYGLSAGAAAASEPVGGPVNVGDYAVEIKDAFKATDYEGKPAIVITFTWTNNSDETTSAMVSLAEKAFQDGVQLESAFLVDVPGYNADADMTEIRPGVSLDVQRAYVLTSSSIVEFEVEEFLGFGGPVTKNFDPNIL